MARARSIERATGTGGRGAVGVSGVPTPERDNKGRRGDRIVPLVASPRCDRRGRACPGGLFWRLALAVAQRRTAGGAGLRPVDPDPALAGRDRQRTAERAATARAHQFQHHAAAARPADRHLRRAEGRPAAPGPVAPAGFGAGPEHLAAAAARADRAERHGLPLDRRGHRVAPADRHHPRQPDAGRRLEPRPARARDGQRRHRPDERPRQPRLGRRRAVDLHAGIGARRLRPVRRRRGRPPPARGAGGRHQPDGGAGRPPADRVERRHPPPERLRRQRAPGPQHPGRGDQARRAVRHQPGQPRPARRAGRASRRPRPPRPAAASRRSRRAAPAGGDPLRPPERPVRAAAVQRRQPGAGAPARRVLRRRRGQPAIRRTPAGPRSTPTPRAATRRACCGR